MILWGPEVGVGVAVPPSPFFDSFLRNQLRMAVHGMSISLSVIFRSSSLLHLCLAARVTILCPQWQQSPSTVIHLPLMGACSEVVEEVLLALNGRVGKV